MLFSLLFYYIQNYPVVSDCLGILFFAELDERSPIPRKMWYSTHPRNFGIKSHDLRPIARPSALQAYQFKITQSTGMATQMYLEVILAGNRIATR